MSKLLSKGCFEALVCSLFLLEKIHVHAGQGNIAHFMILVSMALPSKLFKNHVSCMDTLLVKRTTKMSGAFVPFPPNYLKVRI